MTSAVVADDLVAVRRLLDAGADVNSRNEQGETAFSFACSANALRVAQLLFDRGAEINMVDAGGGSPLDWTVCQSGPELRAWLIGVGGQRRDLNSEPWPCPPQPCAESD